MDSNASHYDKVKFLQQALIKLIKEKIYEMMFGQ
jgi:hypothetical protein